MKRIAALTICLVAFAGEPPPTQRLADGTEITRYEIQVESGQHVPYPGTSADIRHSFPQGFPLSVGSGLAFAGQDKDGTLRFWGLTDRGPNGDAPEYGPDAAHSAKTKVFPAPAFTPSLVQLEVRQGKARVAAIRPLRGAKGPVSGLPLPVGQVGSTEEVALSEDLRRLEPGTDPQGLDPEGIAIDPAQPGILWLCDEYGPFILKVEAATGTILQTFAPGRGLPTLLRQRQPNRGFEGIAAAPDGRIYALVQSILDFSQPLAGTAPFHSDRARFLRLVELDPRTGKFRMFAYPHDVDAYAKSKDAKMGDLAALGLDRFLTLEQGLDRHGIMRQRIYLVDLAKATDITGLEPKSKALEALDRDGDLAAAGVVCARKTLVLDLRAPGIGWTAEKAEGLAVLPDGQTLAVANDNDFGLRATMVGPDLPSDPTKYLVAPEGTLSRKGKPVTARYRLDQGEPEARPSRLWLIKLPKPLGQY